MRNHYAISLQAKDKGHVPQCLDLTVFKLKKFYLSTSKKRPSRLINTSNSPSKDWLQERKYFILFLMIFIDISLIIEGTIPICFNFGHEDKMRTVLWNTFISLTLIALFALTVNGMSTEMVIINGLVCTLDPQRPIAEAVAISGNRIVAVGTNSDIFKLVTPSTTVISANGRLVLPGFNDAHLHFLSGGSSLMELNLSGIDSLSTIINKVRQAAVDIPAGQWIVGRGWDHTLFNAGQWPNKSVLDKAAPEHPVFLTRIDGHVAWVNSAALQLAGIILDTPNPFGGEIERSPDGEATGILKETAVDLVQKLIPEQTEEQKLASLQSALAHARQLGITSIQDNSGMNTFPLYRRLADEGKLTVRVSEWLDFNAAQNPPALVAQIKELQELALPHHLRIGLLKGFVDGTLGSRTASFFEPYADDPTNCGIQEYSLEELQTLITTADSLGLQVGLHCIGDKAASTALTAYHTASSKCGVKSSRHRIEHAQVLRVEDLQKFAEYQVIASMQPTHCTSDLRWAEQRIGHERCKGAYAWRSILASGGQIAFGTDWPVEPLDPMRGIYSAVTRRNIETELPQEGWFQEQCLTIEEAVYCYTMGSAYAEFEELEKGSITPGKLADLIILDKNIFEIPPEDILTTQVDMTIFDGQVVYSKEKSE
jgi:predicted amidohydrolase YtcJ